MHTLVYILAAAALIALADSFTIGRYAQQPASAIYLSSSSSSTRDDAVKRLSSLSIRELKDEAKRRNIPTSDVFEKSQLVERLSKADTSAKVSNGSSRQQSDALTVPLYWTPLDSSINISDELRMTPTSQLYPTIKVNAFGNKPLNLLLDTACTGLVLKPSVVEKYNFPKMSTPVTMTGAGGIQAATGMTQIDFNFPDQSKDSQMFTRLPVAVQDIGPLPKSLDGIIGLSFISRFEAVEFDMINSKVVFHQNQRPMSFNNSTLVCQSNLAMTQSLGLYTVPVYFGTRGPVTMLVDTGASSTFLNWNGVAQLGLDKQSPALTTLSNFGAFGSDATSLPLTHQLYVSSTVNMSKKDKTGLKLKQRVQIAIGHLPILDSFPGTGGILGLDIIRQASRMVYYGKSPFKVELYMDDQ